MMKVRSRERQILPPVSVQVLVEAPVLSAPARVALQPVILAGGSGTRLWPLSREQYPKQVLNLVANDMLLDEIRGQLRMQVGRQPGARSPGVWSDARESIP
jgi:mannose-1-phosphate guanylyltransferase/mannose-6-phosphate isomerase